MKTVLIITYYWPPAGGPGVQRVLKFVKYLPAFGWRPVVLTVRDGEYPAIDESLNKDVPADCLVFKTASLEPTGLYKRFVGMKKEDRIRVAVLTEKSSSMKKRLSNWIRLNLIYPDAKIGWKPFAVKEGLRLISEYHPELIFSSSPPSTVQRIARALSKKSGLPWVADFRDPWTNAYYYHQLPKSRLARKIDRHLERQVLHDADRIVTVSEGFFDDALHHKEIQIPNGFDSEDLPGSRDRQPNKKFTIRYMGSLKIRQYIGSFFDALKDLSDRPEMRDALRLDIIGNFDPRVRDIISAKNIPMEINFSGYRNHDEALRLVSQADMLLLVIGRSHISHRLLTGKVFEYIMVRKPILAYGPPGGAADNLLQKTRTGRMFDYEDQPGAAQFIEDHFNDWKNGRQFSNFAAQEINRYERKELTRSLAKLFEDVT